MNAQFKDWMYAFVSVITFFVICIAIQTNENAKTLKSIDATQKAQLKEIQKQTQFIMGEDEPPKSKDRTDRIGYL